MSKPTAEHPVKIRETGREGVMRACLDLLAAERIRHWRMNAGDRFTSHPRTGKVYKIRGHAAGTPDILAAIRKSLHDPTFVWIECKAPGKSLTKEQIAFRDAAEENYESYLLIDDVRQLQQWIMRVQDEVRVMAEEEDFNIAIQAKLLERAESAEQQLAAAQAALLNLYTFPGVRELLAPKGSLGSIADQVEEALGNFPADSCSEPLPEPVEARAGVAQEGWIKCSERLPEKGERVWVITAQAAIQWDGWLNADHWNIRGGPVYELGAISHWRELPAPPKEEPHGN